MPFWGHHTTPLPPFPPHLRHRCHSCPHLALCTLEFTCADRFGAPSRRHTGGPELVAQFESMQQNEAAALCRFTAAASDHAFASVKGSAAGRALPKLSVDVPHLASDAQPLPLIFQGMVSHLNAASPLILDDPCSGNVTSSRQLHLTHERSHRFRLYPADFQWQRTVCGT